MSATEKFDDGIPAFLRIPQEERREAWEKFRAERKAATATVPEPKPYRSINDGAMPSAEPTDEP